MGIEFVARRQTTMTNFFMKKVILTVAIACAVLSAQAQKVSFGVKSGLNISRVTKWDGANSRASVHAGGFVNIGLVKNLSLQPELLYSGQGFKYKPLNAEAVTRLHYINVPVMVQYRFIPEFFVEAGPQLGFLVAARQKVGDVLVDIKDSAKGVDAGIGFGAGYQFPMGIGVSARYMFGLTRVFEDTYESNKNAVAQVGLFYTIKTK